MTYGTNHRTTGVLTYSHICTETLTNLYVLTQLIKNLVKHTASNTHSEPFPAIMDTRSLNYLIERRYQNRYIHII